MTERDMRLAWLHECPGMGPAALHRIISRCGGVPEPSFFGRSVACYAAETGASEALAKSMADCYAAVPTRLAAAHSLPIRAIPYVDIDYCLVLAGVAKRVPILYMHGNTEDRLTSGSFCVITSRDAEFAYGDVIKAAVEVGMAAGRHVITGHNRPVYQLALLAAKRIGRPATLVLDRGLLSAFDEDLRRDPVPAARIWGYAFDSERMCAISPFRLGDPWIGANARLRDELIVRLSDVIVAIGVRDGGTMHNLCRAAAIRGQVVLAADDCLPALAPSGATAWTGEMPPAVPRRVAPR